MALPKKIRDKIDSMNKHIAKASYMKQQILNWCEEYGIDIHSDDFEACFDDEGVSQMDEKWLERVCRMTDEGILDKIIDR